MNKNIRIVSPAKAISAELINRAVQLLTDRGHFASISKHADGNHHYFSGTEQERFVDFQNAIDDPDVDIILCARGGYGCIQIIDDLDFSALEAKPKLIVGFSDITVFHLHCHSLGIPTAHTTMPLNFSNNSEESIVSLLNVIEDKQNIYHVNSHPNNVFGHVKAEIIGGNLAIIQTLIGTDSDCSFNGKILFIEDVSEYVYTIDRMLWSLNKSHKLKNLAGLIVGGMTGIKDTEIPFGKTIEEVILSHVSRYNYPVCFNFPAGHLDDNRALIFGQEATLTVSGKKVILSN